MNFEKTLGIPFEKGTTNDDFTANDMNFQRFEKRPIQINSDQQWYNIGQIFLRLEEWKEMLFTIPNGENKNNKSTS